ncbi:Disulfide bond formation protein D [bacterium HR26]|nr:Disulfide bond formation protein D [bacterium HR26]
MGTRSREQAPGQPSRRAQRRLVEQQAARRRRYMLLGGAVAVAVIATLILILANRPATGDEVAPVQAVTSNYDDIPRDGRVLGAPNAPVLVVEWGDYQCPACLQFKQVFFPQLLKDYIATGKIRFEYRDFAFIGDESKLAAEAALCAQDQGKFWEYHDALFTNQRGENVGSFTAARLKRIAEVIGLDTNQFNSCLDSRRHQGEVEAMRQEAQSLGVNATPTFFVNGRKLQIRYYQDILNAIEAELNR